MNARESGETKPGLGQRPAGDPTKTGHLLLVGVSSSPSAETLLRWSRGMAEVLHAPWIALFVEAPGTLSIAGQEQTARNLTLAAELGAEVITTTDDDLVRGLLRVASQRNVTQIIIGQARGRWWRFPRRDAVLRRLVRESANVDIHIIRAGPETPDWPHRLWRIRELSTWSQYLLATGIVMAMTLVAFLAVPFIGGTHSVPILYLLAVVVVGSMTGRGPTLLAATLSALCWDFFILPPVYAFRITRVEDSLLLGMYFVVALIMGQHTSQMRAQQAAERLREERATALYLLSRELNEAAGLAQIAQAAARQMAGAFDARIIVLRSDAPESWEQLFPPVENFKLADGDKRAAARAFQHGQRTGKFTGNLPEADLLFVPFTTGEGAKVVIGLGWKQTFPPTIHQLNLLDAFLEQITLALDRLRLREVSEQARLLAESERLSQTLLNSMSHEIRTPRAVINSATSNLVEFSRKDWPEPERMMIAEVQEATARLNRLVGKVLDITRLESGHVKPKMNECDVRDLINWSVAETEKELVRHKVTVEIAAGLPIVRMDFVLMQEALTNLLSNAAIHTSPGTAVHVSAQEEGKVLVLTVADRGPGIPPAAIPRIFDKFYRGSAAPTGGTGLGLSLVKGFVEAQGGRVQAGNRPGGGAVFTIRLPADSLSPVAPRTSL